MNPIPPVSSHPRTALGFSAVAVAVAATATTLLLGACGEAGAKKTPPQVAARVDGVEISQQQLNAALAHAHPPLAAEDAQARKAALERLVDQQIVYARARDERFDRDPRVAQLVEAARREIVARAYMESRLQAPPLVSPAEVHQYYVENPALFARRRVYELQQIVLPADPALLPPLLRLSARSDAMEAIGRFLAARKLDFAVDGGVRAAEQIPLDVLPRLAEVADGRTAVIESGQRYYVFHVIASQRQPIAEAEARPRIEVFLGNQQSQRAIAQEMRRLKAEAHVEYLGEFAPPAALVSERSSP